MRIDMRMTNAKWLLIPLLTIGLAACGDDDDNGGGGAEANTVRVSIVSGASMLGRDAFSPNPVDISPGTTVIWTNNDSVDHTVTSMDGLFDSGAIEPGETFSREFDDVGEFSYFCTIHPNMTGTVVVDSASPTPSPSATPTFSPSPSPTVTPTPTPTNGDGNGGGPGPG